MTRKKVKLAFIENDTSRKATYKKRKQGLLKKVDELTTLCGIDACAIIYSPYDPQPEIWPSPQGLQNVLLKFRTMPELEQNKKMVNQDSFLKQRISKAKEQVKKQQKDNKVKEITMLMFQCLNAGKIVQNNMSVGDLNELAWMIDQNLKEICRRMEAGENGINIHQNQSGNQIMAAQSHAQLQMAPPLPPLPPPLTTFNNAEIAMTDHGHVGMPINNNDIIQRQLFMDMMLNGNGNGTIPFSYDANLQNGFGPNRLS
ncbi:agamous-like MADS-box protein AGL80 [Vicia villosa]|uniref:agamous-like MADS-box protein AGL80 n=1 Tax=Vicia villosa TaxID=3911 RepID=UPI00273B40F1|nr:agamous-like MADS-box protein AGL80 [Vicia villosa]